jgi:mRNA-degrading endonuclease RelE of RelBE toxin-antitoxin system
VVKLKLYHLKLYLLKLELVFNIAFEQEAQKEFLKLDKTSQQLIGNKIIVYLLKSPNPPAIPAKIQ